jgi:sulfur carrier protein ThiS
MPEHWRGRAPGTRGIQVAVHLHGDLQRYASQATGRGVLQLELPAAARVSDVLARLAIPADRRVIVGLDGQAAAPDTALRDGARVDLLPPMAGGSATREKETRTC